MSLDEFWEWQGGQQDRYELIEGDLAAHRHRGAVAFHPNAGPGW